ncbi:MAG TPA: hypothetical protein VF614_08310 [Chthoniobacteraceae bacterium]
MVYNRAAFNICVSILYSGKLPLGAASFLLTKGKEEFLQAVQSFGRVGADRFENNPRAAVEICAKHFKNTPA